MRPPDPHPILPWELDALMRKFAVILFCLVLGAVVLAGCKEDKLAPYFTRLQASETCGVVPFTVQFVARVSGGNSTDNPTGANAYLDINWNFGDGAAATGSLVYHTYTTAGDYPIQVSVKDKDGQGETDTLRVNVRADSLVLRAVPLHKGGGQPDTTVNVGDKVDFSVWAQTCGFDVNSGNYEARFLFRWDIDNGAHVYTGRSPSYIFTSAGQHPVILRVIDDQASITRRDSLTIQVN